MIIHEIFVLESNYINQRGGEGVQGWFRLKTRWFLGYCSYDS